MTKKHHKNIYKTALALIGCSAILAACSGDDDDNDNDNGSSCSVTNTQDGGAVIECPDGTSATIDAPGAGGGDGDGETDCVVTSDDDGVSIDCDGEVTSIDDLECSFADNGNGSITITCGDTETILPTCVVGARTCDPDGVPAECTDTGWEVEEACERFHMCMDGECQVQEGALRLSDGSSSMDGRLEAYVRGRWGSVCDDEFDNNDNGARVACRALGYEDGFVDGNNEGPATMPIVLDDVVCSGDEESLLDCAYELSNDCDHSEDVAISCSGMGGAGGAGGE